jgi:hypothetical protein
MFWGLGQLSWPCARAAEFRQVQTRGHACQKAGGLHACAKPATRIRIGDLARFPVSRRKRIADRVPHGLGELKRISDPRE